MASSRSPELTPVELQLMKAVWGGNRTTREICESLLAADNKKIAMPTVSTYLQRLIQKGYLERTATGGREYLYTALLSKDAYRDVLMEKAESLFKSDSDLLLRFAGKSSVGETERKRLKQIVERLKKKGK